MDKWNEMEYMPLLNRTGIQNSCDKAQAVFTMKKQCFEEGEQKNT